MLRNHAEAIFGAGLGLMLCFVVALVPGCLKTDSVLRPGTKVNASQLQQEKVSAQQSLANDAATLTKATADFNAKVTAENSAFVAADSDLYNQQENLQKGINLLGGAISQVMSGGLNPASLIGTAVTLMGIGTGIGGLAGSVTKQSVISGLRTSQNAPPPNPMPSGAGAVPGGLTIEPFVLPVPNPVTKAA